jgi:hypothetical protein
MLRKLVKRRPSPSIVISCLALFVALGGSAYAATGGSFILGHANSESHTATLTNTGPGPALTLKSRPAAASLAVSSTKKVAHLNADRLDGLEAVQLQTTAYRFAVPTSGPFTSATVTFPGLPAGRWLASYTIITTNSGTGPQCFFRQAAPTTAEALSWAVNAGGFSSDNATGLLNTIGAAGPVKLYCQGASFSFYSAAGDAESLVSFVRVDRQVNHTVTTAVAVRRLARGVTAP